MIVKHIENRSGLRIHFSSVINQNGNTVPTLEMINPLAKTQIRFELDDAKDVDWMINELQFMRTAIYGQPNSSEIP